MINNFTDEYVESFIGTDFSELLNEIVEEPGSSESNAVPSVEADNLDETIDSLSEDLDVDALIDEVNETPETQDDSPLDIGDELLDSEVEGIEPESFVSEDSIPVNDDAAPIDDETLAALSGDFDESTIAQLLNDENDSDTIVELSPDFTDSNVLADLLSDDNSEYEVALNADNNAEEVDGIKELDNLDFDDLLANIEEETSQSSSGEFELSEDFDIGDELDSNAGDDELEEDDLANESAEKDFISVDSLLSDSLLDGSPTEPYEKMNIDVGLGEFPEFSGEMTEDDIDDDDNGVSAKLDLAKVYIEIGDTENAEVILLDVVKQGDAQQQFDAQQLLDSIN